MTFKNEQINQGDTKMGKEIKKTIRENEKRTLATDTKKVVAVAKKIDYKESFNAFKDFIRAVALLVTSTFTGVVAYKNYVPNWYGYLFVGCAVLIGLEGMHLFLNHFKKER